MRPSLARPVCCGLLACACGLVGAVAPAPAHAAPYRRKVIAVFRDQTDPLADAVRDAFLGLKRFRYLAVPVTHREDVFDFLSGASRAAVHLPNLTTGKDEVYALVPRLDVGPWYRDGAPEVSTTVGTDGVATTRTTVRFAANLDFQLLVYDLANHTVIGRYTDDETDTRSVEEQVRSDEPAWQKQSDDIAFQADLISAAAASRPREIELEGYFDGFAASAARWARSLPPFQLYAAVSRADLAGHRVDLDLGSDVGVGLDDGFQVYRSVGGVRREIGYVKVRKLGPEQSEVEPILLSSAIEPGDELYEHVKAMIDWSLAGGAFPLGIIGGTFTSQNGVHYSVPGSALVPEAALRAEFDLAGWLGVSELYGVVDGDLMGSGLVFGGNLGVGLLKKQYFGRWGLEYGGELGGLMASVQTGPVPATSAVDPPGGYDSSHVTTATGGVTGLLGLTAAFTPDWFGWVELDGLAYVPAQGWSLTAHSSAANQDRDFNLTGTGPLLSPIGVGGRAGIGFSF